MVLITTVGHLPEASKHIMESDRHGSYESGRTRPRAGTIRLLAGVLGVDVLDLIAEDTTRTLSVLRARLGLTQQQTAQQLGTSRSL